MFLLTHSCLNINSFKVRAMFVSILSLFLILLLQWFKRTNYVEGRVEKRIATHIS